jgi:hypothetical protein
MNGVYVRALLMDIIHNKGSTITALDLGATVQLLIETGQLTPHHIDVVRGDICGYTLCELAVVYPNAVHLLNQAYALIAETSGYTDDTLLNRGINLYPKYRKILPALRNRMAEVGRIGV